MFQLVANQFVGLIAIAVCNLLLKLSYMCKKDFIALEPLA